MDTLDLFGRSFVNHIKCFVYEVSSTLTLIAKLLAQTKTGSSKMEGY